MTLVGARNFLISPPETKWFAVIFEANHDGKRITFMSSCLLTNFILQSKDCGVSVNVRNKKIPEMDILKLYTCIKDDGCLVRITPSNTVDKVVSNLKVEVEREKLRNPEIKKDEATPAPNNIVQDLIDSLRENFQKEDI